MSMSWEDQAMRGLGIPIAKARRFERQSTQQWLQSREREKSSYLSTGTDI